MQSLHSDSMDFAIEGEAPALACFAAQAILICHRKETRSLIIS